MARLKNIGDLAYHNLRIGDDCIKIKYDRTKADQSGVKVVDKYLYVNSIKPLICHVLVFGFWLYWREKG